MKITFQEQRKELESYSRKQTEVENLNMKILSMERQINSVSSSYDKEHIDTNVGASRTEQIAKLVDLKEQWQKLVIEAELICYNIKKKLDQVKEMDYDAYNVMFSKYINLHSMEEIEDIICCSRATTHRYLLNGLKLYANIDNEIV